MPTPSKSCACDVLRSCTESKAKERARGPLTRIGQPLLPSASRSSISLRPSSVQPTHSGAPDWLSGGRTRTATRTFWPPTLEDTAVDRLDAAEAGRDGW